MRQDETHQFPKLQTCFKDIINWMSHNFLLLHSHKLDVIVLGPKHIRDSLSNNIVNLDGLILASRTTVGNLVVSFDQDCLLTHMFNRFEGLPFFTSVTLLKPAHPVPTRCSKTSSSICYFQAGLL